MTHHINLFDIQNEIKRMESTPIGSENKPIGVTSNEKSVIIDLNEVKYRNLVIDVYGIDLLNRLLNKEVLSGQGEHPEGGKYSYSNIQDNTWKITEYILE